MATKMPIPPAPVPIANNAPSSNVSTSVTSVISANASAAVAAASAANAPAASVFNPSGSSAGNNQSAPRNLGAGAFGGQPGSQPGGQPGTPMDMTASGALAAALGTIDAQPRRPSAYASHVAEAVRAHLQGKIARAQELLVLCIEECPADDPAAQRNLQRLKERLGVKEER
jgi:hypothetical protein